MRQMRQIVFSKYGIVITLNFQGNTHNINPVTFTVIAVQSYGSTAIMQI